MSTVSVKLLVLFQTTIIIANELCADDKWSIVNGNWSYSNLNCTLQSFNKYYNETILIWYGDSEDSYPWTSYDEEYNHKFFSLELVFSVNLDISQYERDEVEKLQTGIIWYTSKVTDQHNKIAAYFYGVRCINGETRFGQIQDSWKQLTDSDTTVSSQQFVPIPHILRVDAIGSIYQFYLDNIFQFEWIDTLFDHGTIGIRSKYCPATYYSLNMNIYNISDINITYNNILYCNDYIIDKKIKHKMSYYKLVIIETKRMEFELYGELTALQFYLFDDNFNIIINCQELTNCNEMDENLNIVSIDNLNPGNYTIVIGSPDAAINDVPYNVSIICQIPYVTDSDFVGSLQFIVLIIALCGVILFIFICILYILYWCFAGKKNKNIDKKQYIKNGLAVIISIGNYDKIVSNPDISGGYFSDLDVEKDVNNLHDLFKLLNYKIMPEKSKTRWSEHEVVTYLRDIVGKEISKLDENNNLFYDGLIVCISCHGIEHKIVTSDYRTIEKTVIHRIISIKCPQTRIIPRIFLFDSCEGTGQKQKSLSLIAPSTINIEEFRRNDYDYIDDDEKIKGFGLNDDDELNDWHHHLNPDYKLVQIDGANPGFQAKFNNKTGSYLLYEFSQKMKKHIMNNDDKMICEIFQEIQNDLHDRGKQQIVTTFYNNTQFFVIQKNKMEKLELSEMKNVKLKSISKGSYRYENVEKCDISDDDEDILKDTLMDVLRMPSVVTPVKPS